MPMRSTKRISRKKQTAVKKENQETTTAGKQWYDQSWKSERCKQGRYADGSRWTRGAKRNPRRKKGGRNKYFNEKYFKHEEQNEASKETENSIQGNKGPSVRFYFANFTYASEKALVHLIERDDDVVLLAELHKNKEGTEQLVNFFGKHGWKATGSPARPTERSDAGNTGGVLAAVKNHIESRPPATAIDAEGKLTDNAQLTGRLIVLSHIEILTMAGYMISGLGFAGTNHDFLIDVDFMTRGGKAPFILALDANVQPEEWELVSWGETTVLQHLGAEIVVVTDSEITCTGARNTEGGRNIDYFIVSISLIGSGFSCTTDFARPWAPHF